MVSGLLRHVDLDVAVCGVFLILSEAGVVVGEAHKGSVISVLLKVNTEFSVFFFHAIVGQSANKYDGDDGTEHSKTTANPEGASVSTSAIRATEGIDHRRERYEKHG